MAGRGYAAVEKNMAETSVRKALRRAYKTARDSNTVILCFCGKIRGKHTGTYEARAITNSTKADIFIARHSVVYFCGRGVSAVGGATSAVGAGSFFSLTGRCAAVIKAAKTDAIITLNLSKWCSAPE